jgi:chromate transporter
MKEYIELFLTFLKMGCITFGGGYAMIPVVDRELIKKKGWVTMDEVMDYYTIAQITPGIIAVNLSTFVGHKRKGAAGGVLATLGFVLPGVTLITVLALFISNFADIPAVRHAFTGIRIAVGALILDTVIKLVKGVFKDAKALAIYVIVFVISVLPQGILPAFLKSPVLLVLVSGLAGLFLYRPKKIEAPSGSGGGEK